MPEAAMEEIQPASERTRTIPVVTRKVAEGKELERLDSVLIRPIPFRRWPRAIGCITNLLQYIPGDGFDFNDNTQLAVFAGTLLGQVENDLFDLLELATDRAPDFFDTIDGDDAIKIIAAVVEVNKDFFLQNVMPLVEEYRPAVTEKLTGTLGPTQ